MGWMAARTKSNVQGRMVVKMSSPFRSDTCMNKTSDGPDKGENSKIQFSSEKHQIEVAHVRIRKRTNVHIEPYIFTVAVPYQMYVRRDQ